MGGTDLEPREAVERALEIKCASAIVVSSGLPVSRSNSREFAALANGPLPRLWVGLMGLPVEIELQHIHPGFTEGAESSAPIEESGSHMTPRWREADSNPRSP